MWKRLTASSALLCLLGCSPTQDIATATTGITTFHKQLDAQDFDGIYQATDPMFKTASPEATFEPLLSAIHRKLGNFRSGAVAGWNDNVTTTGHFISLNYSAKYERGDAVENFVYRVDGQQVRLAGYHVNSNALIVN